MDETMGNKRFPQQRFSPINPVRARSETPKSGRYFSPIPVTRPWTPDCNLRSKSLVQPAVEELAVRRSSSQTRDYPLSFTGAKCPSMLQSGPTSAFRSLETCRTVSSGDAGKLLSATEEKCQGRSANQNNHGLRTLASFSQSEGLLCSHKALPSGPVSVKTAFQTKPPQTVHHSIAGVMSLNNAYSNRTVSDLSALDRSAMSEIQCEQNSQQLMCTSNGNLFASQALSYRQLPPGSYVPPFVAFYPGLHFQDKVMSPLGPPILPNHVQSSSTALLRQNLMSHPLVNTLISPVLNIQVQPTIAANHSVPQANNVEKLPTKPVSDSTYPSTDPTVTSENANKQKFQEAAILPEQLAPKNIKVAVEKEGKTPKNILKKFRADGMEQ